MPTLLRRAACWLGICFLAAPLAAAQPFPITELGARRAAFVQDSSEDVLVISGSNDHDPQHRLFPFRQDDTFYYLTGWNEPGATLVFLRNDRGRYEEYLFLPNRNSKRERWDGPRAEPGDGQASAATGIKTVLSSERISRVLEARRDSPPKVGWAGGDAPPDWIAELLAPQRLETVADRVDALRRHKSASEIARIRHATQASIAAHRAAWARIRAGSSEREIAGVMLAELMSAGCWRPAYAPIVGAGPNSTTLHYNALDGELQDGDVVLMDVGGEFEHYAADITRTVPVSGRFTKRQRIVYEIVLAAHDAALAAARPGVRLDGQGATSLGSISRSVLDRLGRQRLGRPLGEAMMHGVGHHVGLAVHDPVPSDARLKPGAVFTIEPGVYLPEENLGIRIESMVLMTEDGAENLSAALPTDPAEIENILRPHDAQAHADSLESRALVPTVRNIP